MTRPKGSNRSFVDGTAPEVRKRLHVVVSPLIAIVPLGTPVDIGAADAAIFTSGNGVKYAPQGAGRRAYCVGEQTTQRARQAGWDAIFAGNDAATLVDKLRQIAPSQTLIHAHGVHVRVDVASQLQKAGLDVTATPVYDQILQPLTDEALEVLKGKAPVLVPLFSPRTAKHFAELAPDAHRTIIIAISKAVADQCTLLDLSSVFVADEPTAQSMVKQLENLVLETGSG